MISLKKFADIYKSSAVVSIWTLISRILGFARDILFAVFLGSGPMADAFLIAFRLPSLFRRFFAEGTFSAAFIPLLSEKNENDGLKEGLVFTSKITSILLLVVMPLIILAEIFMPNVVLLIAPGFLEDLYRFELAVPYARIVFPYLIFIIITSLLSASLNTNGKFWAGAAAPVILNLLMIFALLLGWVMQKDQGLMLSWGVLFAGACQMLLLAWANNKNGLSFGISLPTLDESVKKFIKRFIPSALGAGTTQINLLVSSIFASQIPGAISWLYYSDRVAQLPLGIIGVAIGTVLLPDLSKKISLELKEEGYSVQEKAILISIFFALPASVALIYMPDLIINALFGYGVFSASDVAFTANALKVYAFGIPAFMLIKILSPLFFARQDIKTPVIIAGFSTILNIFLTWFLVKKMGFVGIAVSLVIAGWINAVILFLIILLKKFYVPNLRFFYVLSIIIISTFFMLISLNILNHAFITLNQSLSNFPEIFKLFCMVVIGLLSYLGVSYIFKLFRYLK